MGGRRDAGEAGGDVARRAGVGQRRAQIGEQERLLAQLGQAAPRPSRGWRRASRAAPRSTAAHDTGVRARASARRTAPVARMPTGAGSPVAPSGARSARNARPPYCRTAGLAKTRSSRRTVGPRLELRDEPEQPLHVRPRARSRRRGGDAQIGRLAEFREAHSGEQPVGSRARRHTDEVAQERGAQAVRLLTGGRAGALELGEQIAAADRERRPYERIVRRELVAGPEREVRLDGQQRRADEDPADGVVEARRPASASAAGARLGKRRAVGHASRKSRSQVGSASEAAASSTSATPGAPSSSPAWSTVLPPGSTLQNPSRPSGS